jgi:hypothetical protein
MRRPRDARRDALAHAVIHDTLNRRRLKRGRAYPLWLVTGATPFRRYPGVVDLASGQETRKEAGE